MKYRMMGLVFAGILSPIGQSSACGGFFCQTVPIDQAGEQIVFHQAGNDITAMVRILYQGDAEDFSWVVPVPTSPELSIGSDRTFDQLDLLTRPQFVIREEGERCDVPDGTTGGGEGATTAGAIEASNEGVTIEDMLEVGPFDIQVLSSTNPDELATWLTDNGYDLSDRGRDLIAPYVTAGMKFVALKLRKGESSGSIQPLVMKYRGTEPMIPIRLTAVAAQDDMGVLTWVVSDARAVPENFKHVIPNYTRLNWYAGVNNAYASYQSLVTAAMDEAGGQGFATDFAGLIDQALIDDLPNANALKNELRKLDSQTDDSIFISDLLLNSTTPAFQLKMSEALPLREGEDSEIYFSSLALLVNYTADELAAARISLRAAFVEIEIEPIENGVALLPKGRYLTRLYTTLSADEMTLDPVFVFNSDMPDQQTTRNATLRSSCETEGTKWTLTLGEGTGRDGEVVIVARGPVPFGSAPQEVTSQAATSIIEETSADALPNLVSKNNFTPVSINGASIPAPIDTAVVDDDDGFFGAMGWWWLLMAATVLLARRSISTRDNSSS